MLLLWILNGLTLVLGKISSSNKMEMTSFGNRIFLQNEDRCSRTKVMDQNTNSSLSLPIQLHVMLGTQTLFFNSSVKMGEIEPAGHYPYYGLPYVEEWHLNSNNTVSIPMYPSIIPNFMQKIYAKFIRKKICIKDTRYR